MNSLSHAPPFYPDLSARVDAHELMDDLSIDDERLEEALLNLRWTNRLLGGYAATNAVLDPLLRDHDRLRILDVGTGSGDEVARLVERGAAMDCRVDGVGVDVNPATVDYACDYLDDALAPALRKRASVETGDALSLPYPDDAFDVVHASLFLHHLFGNDAVQALREMRRVSRRLALVNDLHRHPLAYLGIRTVCALLPVSPMYAHDAPTSVRRGFTQTELHALATQAAWPAPTVRWHWAFRYTLTADVG